MISKVKGPKFFKAFIGLNLNYLKSVPHIESFKQKEYFSGLKEIPDLKMNEEMGRALRIKRTLIA